VTKKSALKTKARALQDALQDKSWSYCACVNLLNKHGGDVVKALDEALRTPRRKP
jgi:hypothetical protein